MNLLKRAGEYFKNHVSVHTFHFTSDGMAFQGKSDAEAHARTLTNTEVKTIVRADVEVADEVAENPEGLPTGDEGVTLEPETDTSTSISEPEPEHEDNPEPDAVAEEAPVKVKEAKTTTKAKAAKK